MLCNAAPLRREFDEHKRIVTAAVLDLDVRVHVRIRIVRTTDERQFSMSLTAS